MPWLGFFHKMRMSDVFVLLDNVPYSKNDFQNRNKIRTRGTEIGWCWLTVPVLTKGRFGQKINEVEINNADKAWMKRCWKSIKYSYSQSKYFEEFYGFFQDLYHEKSWTKLVDLNVYLIEYWRQFLDLDTKLVLASDICEDGSGTELLVSICNKLGSDIYISGKFGKEYLDEALFDLQGIQVIYQDFQHPEYSQMIDPFIPNMSVIDLSFNYGKSSKEVLCLG